MDARSRRGEGKRGDDEVDNNDDVDDDGNDDVDDDGDEDYKETTDTVIISI